jgi:hypothetical protein
MKQKADLPGKICAACGRPFAWRRKWVKDWDHVRFCSDACRTGRRDAAQALIKQKQMQQAGDKE